MTDERFNSDEERRAAEALYAHLKNKTGQPVPDLPADEAGLGEELQHLAARFAPPEGFEERLGRSLETAAQQRATPGRLAGLAGLLRPLAFAGAGLAILLGLVWIIQSALPPGTLPAAQEPTASATVTSPAPPATEPAAPAGLPTAAPEGEDAAPAPASSTLLPNAPLLLEAGLPESPEQLQLYVQTNPEPLTPENARAAARRIGVEGGVYRPPNEGGPETVYLVSDGYQRVLFFNTPDRFDLQIGRQPAASIAEATLPAETLIATAETFLAERGLLDFPYRAEIDPLAPHTVRFLQELDGIPVRLQDVSQMTQVTLDASGQVRQVFYNRLRFEPRAALPVRSAAQAWEKLQSPELSSGATVSQRAYTFGDFRAWVRSYTPGETADLYGYVQAWPAVEAGQPPLVTLNDLPLDGEVAALAAAVGPADFLHVWGRLTSGPHGETRLEMEGWEVSPLAEETFSGVIEAYEPGGLLATDTITYVLPNLPEDVPDGTPAQVRGVALRDRQPPWLEWFYMSSGEGGGGGGGGGGLAFGQIVLDPEQTPPAGQPAQPESAPGPAAPYADGERVEALVGQVYGVIFDPPGGEQSVEVYLNAAVTDDQDAGLSLRLTGPQAPAILELHNLPARVWGVFRTGADGTPELELERFEPAYPGLSIQAFRGSYNLETVEGREVAVFTPEDGDPFVMRTTLDFPAAEVMAGRLGDTVIVEGYLEPERTWGPYPVLVELSSAVFPEGELPDLADYSLQSAEPPVLANAPGGAFQETVTLDTFELIYLAEDLRYYRPPEGDPALYVQPAWRISGAGASGQAVEILIQATADEYLR